MESKGFSSSHGKREDSSASQPDTLSTSSDGWTSRTRKSLYEFSPHLHRPHKRAKSLKAHFKKANIDFPDMNGAPCTFGVPLSPLPEPVAEDASEDSYVLLDFLWFASKKEVVAFKKKKIIGREQKTQL